MHAAFHIAFVVLALVPPGLCFLPCPISTPFTEASAPLRDDHKRYFGFRPAMAWAGNGSSPISPTMIAPDFPWSGTILKPTLVATAGQESKFQLRHNINKTGEWTVDGHVGPIHVCDRRNSGILVWFHSVGDTVMFAAPAIPYVKQESLSGLSTVKYRAMDPGVYNVHIAVFEGARKEEGARGVCTNILPMRGSPFSLWVYPDKQRPEVPPVAAPKPSSTICTTAHQTRGRWGRCDFFKIPEHECLRDGRVWLPEDCRHQIFVPAEALAKSEEIARARNGRALWAVTLVSSIGRGILHSATDVLGGGVLQSAKASRTVREAFMSKKRFTSARGVGSAIKCWGWSDLQLGHLRLSTSDFRLALAHHESYYNASFARLSELMREGVDLFFAEIDTLRNLQLIFRVLELNPQWDGLVLVSYSVLKLNNGGAERYFCNHGLLRHANVTNPTHILNDAVQALVAKYSAPGTKWRVKVVDEAMMSWAVMFDTEYPMSCSIGSQHTHYYSEAFNNTVPRANGPCGPLDSGRVVHGMQREAMAHIVLGQMFLHLGGGSPPNMSTCAARLPVQACASCPLKSCCPWWPPSTPNHSLSTFAQSPTVKDSIEGMELDCCSKRQEAIW